MPQQNKIINFAFHFNNWVFFSKNVRLNKDSQETSEIGNRKYLQIRIDYV